MGRPRGRRPRRPRRPVRDRRASWPAPTWWCTSRTPSTSPTSPTRTATAARAVDAAAADAGVRRVVYLGGLRPSGPSSRHLTSRAEVADVFLAGPVPTAALEASIVVGSGSASFEMIRYLAERVPVLPAVPWLAHRTQPIAIADVLHYLVGALDLPPEVNRRFDVGGPDVLSYLELIRRYLRLAGLPQSAAVPLPVPVPPGGARAGRLGGGGAHPALAAARHPADRVAVPGARVRRGGRAHGDRAAARRAHDLRRRGAGGAGAPARRRPRRARPRRRPGARGPHRPGGLRGSGVPLEHRRAVRRGRGRPVGGGRRDRGRRRLVRPARRVDAARLDRPAARGRRGLPGTPARTPAARRRRRRRLVRRGRRAGLARCSCARSCASPGGCGSSSPSTPTSPATARTCAWRCASPPRACPACSTAARSRRAPPRSSAPWPGASPPAPPRCTRCSRL